MLAPNIELLEADLQQLQQLVAVEVDEACIELLSQLLQQFSALASQNAELSPEQQQRLALSWQQYQQIIEELQPLHQQMQQQLLQLVRGRKGHVAYKG